MWLGALLALPLGDPVGTAAALPPVVGFPVGGPAVADWGPPQRGPLPVFGQPALPPVVGVPVGSTAADEGPQPREPFPVVGPPVERRPSLKVPVRTLDPGQLQGDMRDSSAPGTLGPPLSAPPGGLEIRLPPALRNTVEALGASSGVPDGAGAAWYPSVAVSGQNARMGLMNYQAGGTVPVSTSESGGWYANGAARLLRVRTNAVLPADRVKFPGQFWDVQAGGAYLHQRDDGWSWGATLNVGSASDRPFNGLAELTVSALAFVRKPSGDRNGWLFFVASTTNGQVGHNIPIPGVAYEYNGERVRAVIGLPFLTVDYRPTRAVQLEFVYAALTEVQARASYYLTDRARVFAGYEWINHAWLRADRPRRGDETFLYEMLVESGFGWRVPGVLEFRAAAGYAFDRFFVENGGVGFGGRNRVNLAPGPYLAVQLEFKF